MLTPLKSSTRHAIMALCSSATEWARLAAARDGWRELLDSRDHQAIIHDRDRSEDNGIAGGRLGYVLAVAEKRGAIVHACWCVQQRNRISLAIRLWY